MNNFDAVTRTFSNHRQWRDFMAAIHASVTFPGAGQSRAGFKRGTSGGGAMRAFSESLNLERAKA
jgi:hypothetical protein